jgi:hypothetical protein
LVRCARSIAGAAAALVLAAPAWADPFWDHWGDGKAEVAAYDLVYPRYGAERKGTAIAIFVTETFAPGPGVKSEDPARPASETVPVMKLNLVQDFSTGIYDYNLMTSAFVALDGRRTLKVAFSSQEWCGQVYSQARLDRSNVRLDSHSYFDGEADATATLPAQPDGLAEDALLVWARGLAEPQLEPGATAEVPLLRSLELARLTHVPVAWDRATLWRAKASRQMTVPAGTFEVEERTVVVQAPKRTWTLLVERAEPHRIVGFARDDGIEAKLVASKRMAYWKLNGPGRESALGELGLKPRPPRTP